MINSRYSASCRYEPRHPMKKFVINEINEVKITLGQNKWLVRGNKSNQTAIPT